MPHARVIHLCKLKFNGGNKSDFYFSWNWIKEGINNRKSTHINIYSPKLKNNEKKKWRKFASSELKHRDELQPKET